MKKTLMEYTATELRNIFKVDCRLKFKNKLKLIEYIKTKLFLKDNSTNKHKLINEPLHFIDGSKENVYIKKDVRFEFGYVCDVINGVIKETKEKVFNMTINKNTKKLKSFNGWILYKDISKFRLKNGHSL